MLRLVSASHRGATSRRHLVAAALAAVVGRGYFGRHRLADPVLARRPVAVAGPPVVLSRASIGPRLSVLRAPRPTDLAIDAVLTATILADTMPHPVLALPTARSMSADDQVYAAVDDERDEQALIDLTAGGDVRADTARHTA